MLTGRSSYPADSVNSALSNDALVLISQLQYSYVSRPAYRRPLSSNRPWNSPPLLTRLFRAHRTHTFGYILHSLIYSHLPSFALWQLHGYTFRLLALNLFASWCSIPLFTDLYFLRSQPFRFWCPLIAHRWIIFAHWCLTRRCSSFSLTDPRFRISSLTCHTFTFRRLTPTNRTSHSRAVGASLYHLPHTSLTDSPTATETALDVEPIHSTQKPIVAFKRNNAALLKLHRRIVIWRIELHNLIKRTPKWPSMELISSSIFTNLQQKKTYQFYQILVLCIHASDARP